MKNYKILQSENKQNRQSLLHNNKKTVEDKYECDAEGSSWGPTAKNRGNEVKIYKK